MAKTKKPVSIINETKIAGHRFEQLQGILKVLQTGENKTRKVFTRQEIRNANGAAFKKKSAPSWISHNEAAKVDANPAKGIAVGSYNLSVFKLDKSLPVRKSMAPRIEVKATRKGVKAVSKKKTTKKVAA